MFFCRMLGTRYVTGQATGVLLTGRQVGQDQPTIVKEIVEKWIPNVEFF